MDDNKFESDFYRRALAAGIAFEKGRKKQLSLVPPQGLELPAELVEQFEKCNQRLLYMIYAKDRSRIVNYELTQDEKDEIVRLWEEEKLEDLNEIVKAIWGNGPNGKPLDGRSKEGRATRAFLTSRDFAYKTIKIEKLPEYVLTEEQKDFIRKRYTKIPPNEIAQEFFKDPELNFFSRESKAFETYVVELQDKFIEGALPEDIKEHKTYTPEEVKNLENYRPPSSIDQVVYRINKAINENWNGRALTKEQMVQAGSIKKMLWTYSFVNQINAYKNADDRELFENQFIKYCVDKPDLIPEEADDYCELCAEYVYALDLKKQIEELKQEQRIARETGDKIFSQQSYTESINSLLTARKNSIDHQEKLKGKLLKDRKSRIDARREENASILNLVNEWKDEEFRRKTIHLAELEKIKLEEVIEEISSIESIKALIRGATCSELRGT